MAYSKPVDGAHSLLTEMDIYLFREGRHYQLYEKFGSHSMTISGVKGTYFAVWAPNAESVHVMGDFNYWDRASHPLYVRWDSSGIFEGFVPGLKKGELYKYLIVSKNGMVLEKGDPFAFSWEVPPKTASVISDLEYKWKDATWMQNRKQKNSLDAPISVYEVHFGSYKKHLPENRSLSYREMAEDLPKYVKEMGFTHVEFMPLMEHPFYGSWGYQKVGYFAPSSRYGSAQDFMYLIDKLHEAGIGVFLDWVPSHFPSDSHGLALFDGTSLYEHEDPKKGFHPDWSSYIFNYGRSEVRSFLISSACFWLQYFHIDGLRVDAVSSMLYLNYSRKEGEWIPNVNGGKENLEALEFVKDLNQQVYAAYPDVQMIAEESTAWPLVSKPTSIGGLGFGMKWNMGWMHDTLHYFSLSSVYRKYHHHDLLFSMYYFYNENFLLSLSHDEVVHGKGSLLRKMSGDDWQKYANLRNLFSYMYTHPGKKLLFMGMEFAQWDEWDHEKSLDWHLLQYGPHIGMQNLVKDLNHLYTSHPALYEQDYAYEGFSWIEMHDSDNSVIAYLRRDRKKEKILLVICNFTEVVRENYHLSVEDAGSFTEIFNSDQIRYDGSNYHHNGKLETFFSDGMQRNQLKVTLPPLATLIFSFERKGF